MELASLPIFMTSLISFEPSSFLTFSAMTFAVLSLTFSLTSLVIDISVNSLRLYYGISSIANLDKRGSIIFSVELAVAKTQDVS